MNPFVFSLYYDLFRFMSLLNRDWIPKSARLRRPGPFFSPMAIFQIFQLRLPESKTYTLPVPKMKIFKYALLL